MRNDRRPVQTAAGTAPDRRRRAIEFYAPPGARPTPAGTDVLDGGDAQRRFKSQPPSPRLKPGAIDADEDIGRKLQDAMRLISVARRRNKRGSCGSGPRSGPSLRQLVRTGARRCAARRAHRRSGDTEEFGIDATRARNAAMSAAPSRIAGGFTGDDCDSQRRDRCGQRSALTANQTAL
jgi:hypothetical protein